MSVDEIGENVYVSGAAIIHDAMGNLIQTCETLENGGQLLFSRELYGDQNEMVNCTVPMLYLRCYRCLVISHDGSGHTSPCMPKYTISGLRTDIYAKPIYQMFQFRVKKSDGVVHYLNIDSGRFEVLDGQSLLCPATDGILDSFSGEKYLRLTYSACAFKRFSIVIAVLMNGCWRLRYRIVPSAVHGILVFKMRSTLHFTNGRVILPDDFKLNTILVVGIKPSGSFKINFRIFANEDGQLDTENFNGYLGDATLSVDANGIDASTIDDNIDGENHQSKKSVKFDHRLYEQPQEPVASFRSQRREHQQ